MRWSVRRTIALVVACIVAAVWAPAIGAPTPPPKRARPNYDGRGNEDRHAGSRLLWIPRVVLAPFYAINEYVLRRPLGWLVRLSEADHWVETVLDVVTFGADNNFLLVPTALFDFGLRSSVGLYFAGDHVFHPHNQIRIHTATGGSNWFSATVLDRFAWNRDRTSIAGRFEFTRRPDYLFYGIGPSAIRAAKSFYGLQRFDGSVVARQKATTESMITLAVGVRTTTFLHRSDDDLGDHIRDGLFAMPPGLDEPYTDFYQRADLVLDERDPAPAPSSGGYLRVHGQTNFDPAHDRSWLEWGGVIGAAADVTGHQRTVKLSLGVDFVDPIEGSGANIPFTELAVLGSDQMSGFVTGWMIGRSTIISQLAYTWPIWTALDGEARFAVGNAFGEHLEDLTTRKLRMSGAIGITTAAARDAGFEVLLGLGTETFEAGAGITSVRLTIGSRRGF